MHDCTDENEEGAMNKTLKLVLIIVSVLTTCVGVTAWGVARPNDKLDKVTSITVDGDTEKSLKAELYGFYPGNAQEYVVTLGGKNTDDYFVTVTFRDAKKGSLENFLTVEISSGEITVKKTLKELLGGEKVSLGRNASRISIVYTMPEDVGNEAKGSQAVFFVDVSAKSGVEQ